GNEQERCVVPSQRAGRGEQRLAGSERIGVGKRMAPAKYRRSGGRRRILGNDEERLAAVPHAFVQLGRDLAEPEDSQTTPGSRPREFGLCRRCETNPAAGYTAPELPTVTNRSHSFSSSKIRSMPNGTSPNQTTCGRNRPPHRSQPGGTPSYPPSSANGARSQAS